MFFAYLVISLLFIGFGVYNLVKVKKMPSTIGVVNEYEQDNLAGYTRYRPIISYTASDGKSYKLYTKFKFSNEKMYNDKKFTVHYDPANPARARFGIQYQSIICIVIGSVTLLMFFAFLSS